MSVYKQYCNEIVDENGRLKKITLEYPDNFNFGYDVVDKIANETPEKRALVWCNVEGEEHIFSFADIKKYSNQMANVFCSAGIGHGDRVMLECVQTGSALLRKVEVLHIHFGVPGHFGECMCQSRFSGAVHAENGNAKRFV